MSDTLLSERMRTIRIEVRQVMDRRGRFMGYEVEIDGNTLFYSGNQRLWDGIRAGSFPCDSDGKPFPRNVVYSAVCDWSPD